LEVGEPDFDVPSCVSEAAKAAYDRHLTHYTHSLVSVLQSNINARRMDGEEPEVTTMQSGSTVTPYSRSVGEGKRITETRC